MPRSYYIEFVGGPLCGYQHKVKPGADGQAPAALGEDDCYVLTDDQLDSGRLAYEFVYPGGRRLASLGQ